jgi:putative holliday junction resolvase
MTQPQQPPQSPPRPRRLLALDPGERRIGVAVSDELAFYAHPRTAILVRGAAAIEAIALIVSEEGIDEVVVGRPLSLSGAESAQTRTARRFVDTLRDRLSVPVTQWDERLSSVQAARTVRAGARRRSGDLDSAAAAVVLQAVLDSRRTYVGQ